MNLVVTGGLGFIGSNFIKYWLSENRQDSVINIDKLGYASDPAYLKDLSENRDYTFVKGDINDNSILRKYLKDTDAIVNFAAESHVDNSIQNSDVFVQSNFLGVKKILDEVKERGIRFHQVSTDEVFGTLTKRINSKFRESTRYNPRNPYSATKAAADLMIGAYINTYNINATISYSGNNYGPHQHPEKFVPKIILHAILNKKVPIYGNGEQMRDWVYVLDHCNAIGLILKSSMPGKRYLISSGEELSNKSLATKILTMMGKDVALLEFVKDRPGHDIRYSSDSSRIRNKLKWKPKYSLQDGLVETIKHYSLNLNLYETKIQ
jgi:dTDP-glucose 4,6-dehydratase